MIVILNGPLGVGKTETAWKLIEKFERAAILDSDYIGGNIRPFDYENPDAVTAAANAVAVFATYQSRMLGIRNFVVSGVFETADQLGYVTEQLAKVEGPVVSYLLLASAEVRERRIRGRSGGVDSGSEIDRSAILAKRMALAAGNLGLPLDSSALSVEEVADRIWEDSSPQRLPDVSKSGIEFDGI